MAIHKMVRQAAGFIAYRENLAHAYDNTLAGADLKPPL
jgi:hypothetical protein